MPPSEKPIKLLKKARFIDFETEDGIFGFRYARMKFYRWETHGKGVGSNAIHFFFDSGTASIVGHGLRALIPKIREEKLAAVRLGSDGPLVITYVSVIPEKDQRKHEAVNRG